jgi:cell division protein ZapA
VSAAEKANGKGGLTLNLLGRDFRVACPEGEEKQLVASADYLNRKLQEIRDLGNISGNERIAIMAALNIAHEMMAQRPTSTATTSSIDGDAIRRRIVSMQEAVDSALAADQEKLF